MAKNAHLTFDKRQTTEVSLCDKLKFKEIGELLEKDLSTISKVLRNHYKVVEKSTYNPCANRRTCKHYGIISPLLRQGQSVHQICANNVDLLMLDFELAEIYGYTTTKFNQRVKNNIEKFDEDFMFQRNYSLRS